MHKNLYILQKKKYRATIMVMYTRNVVNSISLFFVQVDIPAEGSVSGLGNLSESETGEIARLRL